jgi:phenylalanyl-tRNA synthetase beta chain
MSVEHPFEVTTGLVPGTVIAVRPHPLRDHIWIADVQVAGDRRQIIFGGTDSALTGRHVLVALPGARLPDGTKVRRRRYAGEVSDGMLCSAAEAGLGTDTTRVHVVMRETGDGK